MREVSVRMEFVKEFALLFEGLLAADSPSEFETVAGAHHLSQLPAQVLVIAAHPLDPERTGNIDIAQGENTWQVSRHRFLDAFDGQLERTKEWLHDLTTRVTKLTNLMGWPAQSQACSLSSTSQC